MIHNIKNYYLREHSEWGMFISVNVQTIKSVPMREKVSIYCTSWQVGRGRGGGVVRTNRLWMRVDVDRWHNKRRVDLHRLRKAKSCSARLRYRSMVRVSGRASERCSTNRRDVTATPLVFVRVRLFIVHVMYYASAHYFRYSPLHVISDSHTTHG